MNEKQEFGREAEQRALDYLLDRGYLLIERNWRTRAGEIDLIMVDEGTLVFVEVKARRSTSYGSAREALTKAKQLRLLKLVQIYLKQSRSQQQAYRIDFVSIQASRGNYEIEHLRNIVEAYQ